MRRENWDMELAFFVASRRSTPFAWGQHDCSLFAADAALAITGSDPAAAWRGSYASEAEAMALIDAAGGLRQLVTQAMGEEISPKLAQRGDLVMIEQNGSNCMGVCMGVNLVAAHKTGLVNKPMSRAIAAWRVE